MKIARALEVVRGYGGNETVPKSVLTERKALAKQIDMLKDELRGMDRVLSAMGMNAHQ